MNPEEGAPEASEESYGWYVYGIVAGKASRLPGGLPAEGLAPGEPVYAVPYRAIQALVSRVPLREFGEAQLSASLKDLQWLQAKVGAHQQVLEAALALGSVVPMRFCMIYLSKSCVREALAEHYEDFVRALARVDGRGEWGVKVYCDRETLGQRLGEVSDRVKQLHSDLATKGAGAAYFMKKRLDDTLAVERERFSDDCAQSSHDLLSSYAAEAALNALQDSEVTGRPEQMILNGAYLVADEQLAAWKAQVEALAARYGPLGFSYELNGRWPPYNFVTLEEEVDLLHESVDG